MIKTHLFELNLENRAVIYALIVIWHPIGIPCSTSESFRTQLGNKLQLSDWPSI